MKRPLCESIGFRAHDDGASTDQPLVEYANLKLAANGLPIASAAGESSFLEVGAPILHSIRQRTSENNRLCPADQAISQFLTEYLQDTPTETAEQWLPSDTLVLDRHGLSRIYSLPPDKDEYRNAILESYRVFQGVCHNPAKDRRTTQGVFHVVEGGYPVPADKKDVPKFTFAMLLQRAFQPPSELLQLPYTSTQSNSAETFVSLLLRPLVCPEVEGFCAEKTIEVRFFAPGSLVANLDFVESIFGNAGDPYLPENDARLDVQHWSGHTGCVILAPHLIRLTKKELGLPHVSAATERQKKDGMAWSDASEIYNDGQAFKVTCRDHRGVVVTVIADNYFGYCKKEVKGQISYAANLMGMCEEEHAGGTLVFPRFDLGEGFHLSEFHREVDHAFTDVVKQFGSLMDLQPEGYGVDKSYADIVYVPESVNIHLRRQEIAWEQNGQSQSLKLRPNHTYVLPSGYKIEMIKPHVGARWRLVGTVAEGTHCHKPCTVSGGGKSEISKPITDSMISGPVLAYDFQRDFDEVEKIINRNFGGRYKNPKAPGKTSRKLLSADRSLGSVVRLLTPNTEFTDAYNEWIRTVPQHIRDLVLMVKRFYKPDWGDDWRSRFSVDIINGLPGHELKYRKQKLLSRYCRVGFMPDGAWRTFGLRKDFFAAEKLQEEDDISASVVVPKGQLQYLHPSLQQPSYKFVQNCEYRLFQRPDEAIVRGYDKTAEADFSRKGNFFSNYQPLSRDEARAMVEDTILFDQFSKPIRKVIRSFIEADSPQFCVSTSNPRIVDGDISKNPRYLQNRPDLDNPRARYLAEVGARFHRRIPLGHRVPFPVNSVLPGRRNNPADHKLGIRPLAVYNPIHYQELPELFMEFISSLTGKSPSTTGAGSEGALTKGPFNSMPPIIDLNNALVSYIVTGNACFTSSAGYIGPNYRFDHDISLVIPEVWSRMFVFEREPKYLLENGYLDRIDDFTLDGKKVLASRLGYRINDRFVSAFFGRVFSDPTNLFTTEMLRPEVQSLDDYVDGINNIVETQERIAKNYFEDNTVEFACPPLKALLHIMAFGNYEGKDAHDESIRAMFTLENLLQSDWYHERLATQQALEQLHWNRRIAYLEQMSTSLGDHCPDSIPQKLQFAQDQLKRITLPEFVDSLVGTLGADPAIRQN
ncbi:MAG: hypothetical protein R3C28_10475 [Pirellulaceae bacterium]